MADEVENESLPEEIEFVTEEGDTYEAIAEAFDVSHEDIAARNPDLNITQVTPGERLRLPVPRPCPGGTIYIVRPGDTLFRIARRFRTTIEAIIRANPILNVLNLRPGLPICIPGAAPFCSGFFYTVVAGDTLRNIAARYNTTVQAILQANPGLERGRLEVGQRICIPVPQPSPQPPPCPGFIYTIALGDNLFSIAIRYNTTVQAILQANPGLDPNRLFVGQRICIPVPQPAPCAGFEYTIMAGDTLFGIAARFNTTVQAILQANPGLDPNRLFIGQQICIPVLRPPVCPGFIYTIAAGDNIFSLAARYNTTVQAILQANPGLDPNRLFIGQQICIPVPQPPTCPGFIYTAVAGDTLANLARRFNTTVQAILQANPGLERGRLVDGERICIPT